jgi:hypothetical protein
VREKEDADARSIQVHQRVLLDSARLRVLAMYYFALFHSNAFEPQSYLFRFSLTLPRQGSTPRSQTFSCSRT